MIELEKAMQLVKDRIDNSILDNYHKTQKKPLVYTSFDGDYMNFLPHMLTFCKENGYIAMNPEAALGYYVSTVSHGDSKIPVMLDCIAVELLCDEMWLFKPLNGHISEGVLAEIMIWDRCKNKDILCIPLFNETNLEIAPTGKLNDVNTSLMTKEDILNYIDAAPSSDIKDIEDKLLSKVNSQENSATYVVANFFNYKHLDWARAYCYHNNRCPISPKTFYNIHFM